jgi:hypothetical protein
VKVALVTTSPSVRSGIGDATRRLVPRLDALVELRVFVEPECAGGALEGVSMAPIDQLLTGEHDRILFNVGNESAHGFMARAIRVLGGTAVQHAWELPEMARAAFPELGRGGLRGRFAALREGRGVFNRSVVRHADSFLVYEQELRRRILADRNAPTPIGVLEPGGDEELAEQIVKHLRSFPQARVTRRARVAFRLLWS